MTNDYKKIVLKPDKEESIKRFHPWIYSGAIQHKDNNLADGEVVAVYTHADEFVGSGHYEEGGTVVRVLSFFDEPIDSDFWSHRLSVAIHLRYLIMADSTHNSIYRLVNGEGDELPGLVIDIYGKTAVIQTYSVGMHLIRKEISDLLCQLMENKITSIYYKPDTSLSDTDGIKAYSGYLLGDKEQDICQENGLKFHVDWERGQKTGFFIDQRDNRLLFERYAKDRTVLDLFSYTGAFSIYAIRGNAYAVDSVDSSSRAASLIDENVKLNYPDYGNHQTYAEDAFKYLEVIEADQYDLMVLDPPAFAKNRGGVRNALQGYRRLNALAFDKIATGGILFTFSNSQVIDSSSFRRCIFSAAAQSGRRVRILHQLHQATDHTVNIYHLEGEYLDGLVLFVE